MLFRNMQRKYYEEAKSGEEGGGAADVPVKTYTQAEVEALTAGLKAKNDELLGEKKTAAQQAKDAENARIKAEQERAKGAGELEQFEKSLRSEFDKERTGLSAKAEALQSRVINSERKAILGTYTADFIASESLDIIAPLIKAEFDGENVTTQFTDFSGKVITTDPKEFRAWMQKHPAISLLMTADAATGGGATGNKNANSGAGHKYSNALKDLPIK